MSVVGTVSMFSGGGGGVNFRVRFTETTEYKSYDINQYCYFNTTVSHLCVGVSGQILSLPEGTYNMNLVCTGGSFASDTNDYIKLIVMITPN